MNELIRVRSMTIPLTIPSPSPVRDSGDQAQRRRGRVRDLAGDHAGDADDRADREVEDARDDAERLAAREQADRRPLVEDVRDVLELVRNELEARLSTMKSARKA